MKAAALLALAAMLLVTAGVHFLHPSLHRHRASPLHAGVDARATLSKSQGPIWARAASDRCVVCECLPTLQAAPSEPAASIASARVVTVHPPILSTIGQPLPELPHGARAPPA